MKKITRGALCAFLTMLMIFLGACSGERPDTATFEAMDTVMSLTVYGGGDIREKLRSRIEELDGLFDTVDENSEIYRLNREKSADVSSDTAKLLESSLSLCAGSDGCFDITVYPAVLEWGFISGEYKIPDDRTLSELAGRIDHKKVRIDGNAVTLSGDAMIDLGAVAKGYAADCCTELLSSSGAGAAVLDLGGTICLYGEKPGKEPFRVGVADPENPAGYFGYLSCGSSVISTSGGYERYFEKDGRRYIHIIDPSTAAPVDNDILSVTVISQSGTKADAMSTALFVMGLDRALDYYREELRADGGEDIIILTKDGRLYVTDGVFDGFTLAEGYDYQVVKVS